MKTKMIFAIVQLFACGAFAQSELTCKLADSEYWEANTVLSLKLADDLSTADLSVVSGELKYELSDLESNLHLVSIGKSRQGWDVATYESLNYDDTSFLFTLAIDETRERARLAIQVLVDDLDGGTRAHAVECYSRLPSRKYLDSALTL